MDLNAPGLDHDLIRLIPLSEAHRADLRATGAVDHMWNSMPAIQRGAGFDAYFDFMLRCTADGDAYPMAIIDPRANDRLVGVTAYLEPNRLHRNVRIGYTWLDETVRGAGYYAAVKFLLLQRAWNWGAKRVEWQIDATNDRALAAVASLGAKREGLLREHTKLADGTWVDIVVFSLLRDEIRDTLKRLSQEAVDSAT